MKLLVIDDSVVYRMAITKAMSEVGNVEVVGSASNGQIAVEMLQKNDSINVITLDMEMPVMDGIETIKAIRKFNKKVMIIVFSSLTAKGAEKTLEALKCGANDFVTKEQIAAGKALNLDESLKSITQNLTPKIQAFEKKLKQGIALSSSPVTYSNESLNANNNEQRKIVDEADPDLFMDMPIAPKLICVASSTGGPEALRTLVNGIKAKCPVPILLVQHMPPLFTAKLAEMLNGMTEMVEVKEAQSGERLENGVMYIAPGDFHMTIDKEMVIQLNQDEKVSYVRPSATVLFESVAKNFNKQVLTIVLTGMGEDGAQGVKQLVENGSYIYVQDERSSIVWGMPGAVKKMYPNVKAMGLKEISDILNFNFNRV